MKKSKENANLTRLGQLPKQVEDFWETLLLCRGKPNMAKDYPDWICGDCAKENGGKWPKGHVGTFHNGKCGWCDRNAGVTQPRDWGYPNYPKGRGKCQK